MEAGYIYALIDPRDGALRYVGQTIKTVAERLKGHLSQRDNSPKSRWILELKSLGLQPAAMTISEHPMCDLDAEECTLISGLRAIGAELLNVTNGGQGLATIACLQRAAARAARPPSRKRELYERETRDLTLDDAARSRALQELGWGSLPDEPEEPLRPWNPREEHQEAEDLQFRELSGRAFANSRRSWRRHRYQMRHED